MTAGNGNGSKKKLLILADAGKKAGSGHMMRCRTIAGELEQAGVLSELVLLGENGADSWLEEGHDAAPYGAVLLDSYLTSYGAMAGLAKMTKLICMDDTLPYRYPADMIINYNIYAQEMPYTDVYTDGEKLLLGSRYVPLRPAFRQRKESAERFADGSHIKNILLSTGGTDPVRAGDMMLEMVPELSRIFEAEGREVPEYILLLGAFHPAAEELREKAAALPGVSVIQNTEDMAGLMAKCDLAVSAAGSTLWELCAMGVPVITYVLADNQIRNSMAFTDRRLTLYAGDARLKSGFKKGLADAFAVCASMEPEDLARWSVRLKDLNDGMGAVRIAGVIAKEYFS
ncbi:MAG: hypothetical protein IJ930_08380 [Lachnospiraceae bacterium]|nr:hypothetical protein [Lachnospiraceae bacterium]